MQRADGEHVNLPSAREDLERQAPVPDTPQTRSPSFRLAFSDQDFLLHRDTRPVRLQLELMKPELKLREAGIESTVVVFGSARVPSPEEAEEGLAAAEAAYRQAPGDHDAGLGLARARRILERSRYYEEARRFARIVSKAGQDGGGKRRFVIVTGGGPGIMEAANRGAAEVGALSIGHNIVLPHEQAPNPYITPELCFRFHYFAVRKMHLLMRARALAVFPGGYGTMDELFETLCLMQTGKIKRRMPVLLFNEAYWRRLVDFEAMVEEGVIDRGDLDLLTFVETAEGAWDAIRRHYGMS
ncbi:MAG: LOG family protein [Geminicoccaceae bacterium]|nr:LOG family protein [Geminicoccaceae bacterium]